MMTCFILTLVLIANELNVKQLKRKLWKNSDFEMKVYNDSSNVLSYGKQAPGPKAKFIIGNLDLLAGYDIPYQAFSELAQKYGKIIKLQMGSVPSLVINGVENIKEVLIYKGHHFDSRPDLKRYSVIFSGNRDNCECFFLLVF
jgi:cytochrome P450 family 307 subfamily A